MRCIRLDTDNWAIVAVFQGRFALNGRPRLVIIVVVVVPSTLVTTILADWNLDALNGEAFAKFGTLTDSGKLLGRENVEDVAETGCEDGRLALVDHRAHIWPLSVGVRGWEPHVYEREAKPETVPSAQRNTPE